MLASTQIGTRPERTPVMVHRPCASVSAPLKLKNGSPTVTDAPITGAPFAARTTPLMAPPGYSTIR